jgi:hypothetical protein
MRRLSDTCTLHLQPRCCHTKTHAQKITDLYSVEPAMLLVKSPHKMQRAFGMPRFAHIASVKVILLNGVTGAECELGSRHRAKNKRPRLSSTKLLQRKAWATLSPDAMRTVAFRGSFLECAFPKLVFPTVSIHSRNKGDGDLLTVRISLDPCFKQVP